jgi:hypothetical protein
VSGKSHDHQRAELTTASGQLNGRLRAVSRGRCQLDRNLLLVPILVFLAAELALGIWSAERTKPVLLAAAPLTARQQVYTSLTGSSSALLGLALAAVAILTAFAPRSARAGQSAASETRLAHARTNLIDSLLVASFFLLVILVTATAAIAEEAKSAGNGVVATIIEGSGAASIVGLLMSGLGLAIAERSRSRLTRRCLTGFSQEDWAFDAWMAESSG